MSSDRRIRVTTLVHILKDGCVLMLHRVKKKNDLNHDKWVGVGGKAEEGESPEECALREMREETGLTAETLLFRGILTFISDEYDQEIIFLYDVPAFSGTVRDCDEGTLEWVPRERLCGLPIWEGDKIMFRYLEERESFFSLKLRYEGDTLAEAWETYPERKNLLEP